MLNVRSHLTPTRPKFSAAPHSGWASHRGCWEPHASLQQSHGWSYARRCPPTHTAEPLQLREHRPLYPLTPADRLCTTGWCLTGRSGAFGGPEGAGEGGTACGGAKALVLPAGCCTRMLAEQSWGLAGWGSLPDWVLDHWARTRAGALGSGHCGRRHGWVSAARLHASPTTTHNDTKPPCEPWADGSRGQRR